MRKFETGATRDDNSDKLDFSGFLSPSALTRFAQYMHKHRKQSDGTLRSSSNWKKGIPKEAYVESLIRHAVDFWSAWEKGEEKEAEEIACALFFNVQGFLHESLKGRASATNVPHPTPPLGGGGRFLTTEEGKALLGLANANPSATITITKEEMAGAHREGRASWTSPSQEAPTYEERLRRLPT